MSQQDQGNHNMMRDFLTVMSMLVTVHKIAPELYEMAIRAARQASRTFGLSTEESINRIDLLIKQAEKFADSVRPLMDAVARTPPKPKGPEDGPN